MVEADVCGYFKDSDTLLRMEMEDVPLEKFQEFPIFFDQDIIKAR